jgi:hypothetical protein
VDLWHLVVIFAELLLELGGVQLAVRSSSLDNLCLLVQGEVFPGEVGAHVLLEESKDLVVGDGTWVGEVVDAGLLVLSQENGGWEEIGEDGVGVGDIDNALVLGDLGDEVTGVEVVADWHTKSEDEAVGVVFHDLRLLALQIPSWCLLLTSSTCALVSE